MKNDSIILSCLECGTKNRIPLIKLDNNPVCAKCRAVLPVENLGRPVVVNDRTFNREVISSPIPVMVDCWAPWCGPCRAMGPIINTLAAQYRARVKVAKLNLDENPDTGARYAITSVPTLLVVKNGQVVDRLVGALPREQMEAAIERVL